MIFNNTPKVTQRCVFMHENVISVIDNPHVPLTEAPLKCYLGSTVGEREGERHGERSGRPYTKWPFS